MQIQSGYIESREAGPEASSGRRARIPIRTAFVDRVVEARQRLGSRAGRVGSMLGPERAWRSSSPRSQR